MHVCTVGSLIAGRVQPGDRVGAPFEETKMEFLPTQPVHVTASAKAPHVGTAKLQDALNLKKYLHARQELGIQEDAADLQ